MLTQQDFDKLFLGERCFCGSGKSYLNCHSQKHYRHQNEIALDQSKFMHRARSCPVRVTGTTCNKPVIASHSQQRRGPLKQITESGHLVGFSGGPNTNPKGDGAPKLLRVSAKKASTFPGLCSAHDKQLFKDIENRILEPCYRSALGLARRCAFYEAVVHTDAALFLNWLDTVPTFEFQVNTPSYSAELENMKHYASYNWYLLNLINKIARRESTRKLYYYSALIDAVVPFSATGCFCIENDVGGNKLQSFSEKGRKFSYAQLSVLPQENGTTLVSISSTSDRDRNASRRFLTSFLKCGKECFSNAILRTALEYTENIYFRESWLNSLTDVQKQDICNRFDDQDFFSVGLEKPSNSLAAPLAISVPGLRIHQSFKLN